jgi:hypothetical protein
MTSDYIFDDDRRTQLAWIVSGEVFSVATKRKCALVRGRERQLYSLQREPLPFYLQDAGVLRGEGSGSSTPTAFKKMLENAGD